MDIFLQVLILLSDEDPDAVWLLLTHLAAVAPDAGHVAPRRPCTAVRQFEDVASLNLLRSDTAFVDVARRCGGAAQQLLNGRSWVAPPDWHKACF